MVTQIEVDLELHTLTLSRLMQFTGLDNTKEIRDAMLDQVVWKDFIRTGWDDFRPK